MADRPLSPKDFEQVMKPDVDRRLLDALPCPFCGSRILDLSRMGNYVHCRYCGADGPEIQGLRRDTEIVWREALQRWNLRMPP